MPEAIPAPPARMCRRCGHLDDNSEPPAIKLDRPWHLLGVSSVREYVASLGEETYEWALALYVDNNYNLLAVDTVGQGDVSGVDIPFGRVIFRGHALGAHAFILVHNHPSGDPRASHYDIKYTIRLSHICQDLEMPLLGHYVVTKDEMLEVGYW